LSRAPILIAVLAASALAGAASAQTTGSRSGGFLDDLFGNPHPPRAAPSGRVAQMSDTELVVRLDRLENQIRQLTGAVEQLQFRNQQLDQALRQMQDGGAYQSPEQGRPGAQRPAVRQPSYPQQQPAAAPAGRRSEVYEPAPGRSDVHDAGQQRADVYEPNGRRSDVFDPTQHPDAPGAPRPLGTIVTPEPGRPMDAPVGIAGGREAGAPLDLSSISEPGAAGTIPAPAPTGNGVGALPPPPPRRISSTGATAALQTQPPSGSPKDEYDLAYGYMLHKDYALAENAFKAFLHDHPGDRLASDATYWLGESMFQRQRYRDAAESFLAVTTKHEKSGKAPDALYRLGQSLAALGEREAACAALGEVGRKYPRASSSVKQGVAREQKRVHC
jgi:tol-pal system protein YbgF